MTALLLAALTGAIAPADPGSPVARPGVITDPVRCQADPGLSYALYLPSAYTPDRRWPILYVFDPRGRGRLAAELFRDVAERRGFVVASSNDTESDDPEAPNDHVITILLRDTHARLALDPQRLYAAGFSGGARMACGVGFALEGGLAGVIGCGAGFPSGRPPRREMPFAYFGAVGTRDFNYYEMRRLERDLERLDLPARVVFFDGEHDWPPAEVAAQGVEWMEVVAMKQGRIPREDRLVEASWRRDLAQARGLEEQGRAAEAYACYRAVARDLRRLRDVGEAEAALARLREAGIERELRRREKRDRADERVLARALEVLAAIRSAERPPLLALALDELRIDELKKQAAGPASSYETLSAQRRLARIFVDTSFYLPRDLLARDDHVRAALSLSIAAEIRPESPRVWYGLARAWARAGARKRALEALSRLVETGFADLARLETEPDLASIRDEPAFERVLEELRSRGAPAP